MGRAIRGAIVIYYAVTCKNTECTKPIPLLEVEFDSEGIAKTVVYGSTLYTAKCPACHHTDGYRRDSLEVDPIYLISKPERIPGFETHPAFRQVRVGR